MKPLDEGGGGGLPVHDIGPHAARVAEEAHGIGRAQRGRLGGIEEEADEPLRALVGEQDIPPAVHHQAGVGLLLAEHEVQRPPHLRHLGGARVAQFEMKLVISRILSNFELALADKRSVRPMRRA